MTTQITLFEMPQPSFHNTIGLKDKELKAADEKARSLEDRVLQCFYTTHKDGMTRKEVIELFPKYTESSCGRALSNLVTRNKIYKTEEMKDGLHGIGNFVYKLIQR